MRRRKKAELGTATPAQGEEVSCNRHKCTKSIMRRCRRTGRPAPYGYRCGLVMPDGSIVLLGSGDQTRGQSSRFKYVLDEPARVQTVKRIFRLYTEGGLGYRRIAQLLNRECAPTPVWNRKKRMDVWAIAAVRKILRNPTYTGITYVKQPCIVDSGRSNDNNPALKSRQDQEQRRKEDRLVVENSHEAIVSREVFQKAQEIMEEHRSRCMPKRRHNYKYICLLTGLIYCGHCLSAMYPKGCPSKDINTGAVRSDYICSAYLTKGKQVCQRYRVPSEQLDAAVLAKLRQHRALPSASDSRETKRSLSHRDSFPNASLSSTRTVENSRRKNVMHKVSEISRFLLTKDRARECPKVQELKRTLRVRISRILLYFESVPLLGNRTVRRLVRGVIELRPSPDVESNHCTGKRLIEFYGDHVDHYTSGPTDADIA
jgi:hypothetical protein